MSLVDQLILDVFSWWSLRLDAKATSWRSNVLALLDWILALHIVPRIRYLGFSHLREEGSLDYDGGFVCLQIHMNFDTAINRQQWRREPMTWINISKNRFWLGKRCIVHWFWKSKGLNKQFDSLEGLLTVNSCIKVRLDLQADKSPIVVKGPFFPRVVNQRYRIRGTNVWRKRWSSNAK
jgi:hypothetical protein